jgi:hypothetical protein
MPEPVRPLPARKTTEIKKSLRPLFAPRLKALDLDCNWNNVQSHEKERRLLLRVWDVTPEKRTQLAALRNLVNSAIAQNEPGCDVRFEVVMDEGPRYINECDGSSGSLDPRTGVMTHHSREVLG